MPKILRGHLCHAVACICSFSSYNNYKLILKYATGKILYEIYEILNSFGRRIENLNKMTVMLLSSPALIIKNSGRSAYKMVRITNAHHLVHHQVLPAPLVHGLLEVPNVSDIPVLYVYVTLHPDLRYVSCHG
jgi:hypothetical protein